MCLASDRPGTGRRLGVPTILPANVELSPLADDEASSYLSSSSSSFSVETGPHTPLHPSRRRPRHRVRFDVGTGDGSDGEPSTVRVDVIGFVAPLSSLTPDQRNDRWWSPSDHELFKGTALLIAGEIRRRAAFASRALNGNAGGGGSSSGAGGSSLGAMWCHYGHTVHSAYAACRNIHVDDTVKPLTDSKLFDALTHWCRVGHSRRGLERWSVDGHSIERAMERKKVVRAVLEAQCDVRSSFLSSSLMTSSTSSPTTSSSWEDIGRLSQELTRSARMFALALGQADAAAVKEPTDKAPPMPPRPPRLMMFPSRRNDFTKTYGNETKEEETQPRAVTPSKKTVFSPRPPSKPAQKAAVPPLRMTAATAAAVPASMVNDMDTSTNPISAVAPAVMCE